MEILKADVKTRPDHKVDLRLWARDDAGHIIHADASAVSLEAVPSAITNLTRQLAVLASEVTEEEKALPSKS